MGALKRKRASHTHTWNAALVRVVGGACLAQLVDAVVTSGAAAHDARVVHARRAAERLALLGAGSPVVTSTSAHDGPGGKCCNENLSQYKP